MNSHRHSVTRRTVLRGAVAVAAAGATPAFAQSNWPDSNSRDRALSGRRLDRRAVPHPCGTSEGEARPAVHGREQSGARAISASTMVAKSAPDGYTIGAATVGHFAINQYLIAKMPYVAERIWSRRRSTYELPNVAVVAADHVPAKTIEEFIAWAKAAAERHLYRQPRPRHLAASVRRAVRRAHRRRRGACAVQWRIADHSGDAGGRRDFAVDNLASYISQIESGNDARAGHHLGATLADHAERADHGRSGHQGFRGDVVGAPMCCRPARRAHRRQDPAVHKAARRRQGAAEALPRRRRAAPRPAHRRKPKPSPRRKHKWWQEVVQDLGIEAAVSSPHRFTCSCWNFR